MKAKIEIPTGWRRLRKGEAWDSGDRTLIPSGLIWEALEPWDYLKEKDLIIRKKRKAKK